MAYVLTGQAPTPESILLDKLLDLTTTCWFVDESFESTALLVPVPEPRWSPLFGDMLPKVSPLQREKQEGQGLVCIMTIFREDVVLRAGAVVKLHCYRYLFRR